MTRKLVDQVADAVLYEGYILYPYRPSMKTRQRWTFGGLYPKAYHEANGGFDPWTMRTQCLVESQKSPAFHVRLRFLHLVNRTVGQLHQPLEVWPDDGGEPAFTPVHSMEVDDQRYQTWQEAVQREVKRTCDDQADFAFPGGRDLEPIRNQVGQVVGLLVREQEAIQGELHLIPEEIEPGLHRVSVEVRNQTDLEAPAAASRDDALMRSLVSTHMVLELDEAQASQSRFVSSIDPPPHCADHVQASTNQGCWPVLVGSEGQADTMLASPIILYDYPQVASESPGDLFDSTEIDEILSLRIMTLTDEEKREAAANDDQAKALLQRTESLARDEMMNLHGQMKPVDQQDLRSEISNPDSQANDELEIACVRGRYLKPGDSVRINPRGNADVFDVVLKGLTATIEKIERDFENRTHLAVTIDDDPGADFGREGKPGHRFFFEPEDVEPLTQESEV